MQVGLQKILDQGHTRVSIARKLGLDPERVWQWFYRGEVPVDFIIRVCQVMDWSVVPHEFRPDCYPNPWDGVPLEQVIKAPSRFREETSALVEASGGYYAGTY